MLAKVPQRLKEAIGDRVRSILKAPYNDNARQLFEELKAQWGSNLFSAVHCLEQSLDSCLILFKFPSKQWIFLATTNNVERLNNEFQRRVASS
jgi:transposase-like protein